MPGTAVSQPTRGLGPGGGGQGIQPNFGVLAGNSAGHATDGVGADAGTADGNDVLVPLVGGSGGGGGFFAGGSPGAGGGAGGVALLIASTTSITLTGSIEARGGPAPFGGIQARQLAGGGSGGSIRLLAPSVSVPGELHAEGGVGNQLAGSVGRIRIEAFDRDLGSATISPIPRVAAPLDVFLPPNGPTTLRVTSVTDVNGTQIVPNPPGASFALPDVTIDDGSPVTVEVEARNIPVGTIVQLHLFSEATGVQVVDFQPLAGTDALSTASTTVTIPSGFSRAFVRATWSQSSP